MQHEGVFTAALDIRLENRDAHQMETDKGGRSYSISKKASQ